ncbi:ATP-dependent endonuclease [Halomicronema sp. CCY15110]|uniref:ATP-dependent nuclease n=1 Tax=Halomicronema sp. CCY15110 TaxID=2767773 RepID=UPI001951ED89|nr:AAA family ATPase [Halomicronema sp. CCY15110]
MRLQKLHIQNFRKIDDLTINFPNGLCVIVGENNAGKTAIIDALRLMLLPSRDFDTLRITPDDFKYNSGFLDIEISCIFSNLTDQDEVHFQECLRNIGGEHFEVQLNTRVSFDEYSGRVNVKMWAGETEGGNLPSNFYNRIASIYLQPLRDPEKGLRPSQNSQISRLISHLSDTQEKREEFEGIVQDANNRVKALESVINAQTDINEQINSIAGDELNQQTELIFSDPSFRRIIAGLKPEIDGLPYELNGLGYNNLVFTAATLGTLRSSPQFSFRSILVEEPEAHLHPQLQVLLLKHFENVARPGTENEVQVIASSHSPILVSQAPIDSIVSVHEYHGQVHATSIFSIDIDAKIKRKLQRYLDATRGELFFSRRLLMVEGIAEVLLIPVLAKLAGGSLKESSVTLLNANGINFNAFLPLFGESRLKFPVVILTDGDAKEIGGDMSQTASNLKAREEEIPNLCVKLSEITFEHELARSPELLPIMLNAFENLHPTLGKELKIEIATLDNNEEKAIYFFNKFIEKGVSKGEFAQELAWLIDESGHLTINSVPTYIQEAIHFLGVI